MSKNHFRALKPTKRKRILQFTYYKQRLLYLTEHLNSQNIHRSLCDVNFRSEKFENEVFFSIYLGRKKWPTYWVKSEEMYCFEVLTVLFLGLEISPIA